MMGKVPVYTRRYLVRMLALMTAYVVVLIASLRLLRSHSLEGPMLYVVAVAPALPIMGVIWAMGRLLVEMTDEYERMRLVRAMLRATGLCLAVLTGLAFLENADALQQPTFVAFPLWCACLGLSQAFDRVFNR